VKSYCNVIAAFLIIIGLLLCSGCRLLETVASDVGGWDMSACVSSFDTCWELFTDNTDKFEGGFVDAIGSISPE
jgi:hypothetical protein